MIKWLKRSDACAALGVNPRRVRYLGDTGKIPTKFVGGIKLYGIDDGKEETTATQEFLEKSDDRYFFDVQTDTYFFFGLPDQPPMVKVPRTRIDALISDYSNEGGGATVNQLALTYELSRSTIKAILNVLGKTHDSAPFSDETLSLGDEEALTTSLLKAKEQRVLVKAQKKRLSSLGRRLDSADLIKHYVTEFISVLPDVKVPDVVREDCFESPYVGVLGLTDLHIGKRGVDGFDSHVASYRAKSTTHQASELALERWGVPEYWVITCGSDMLHVDNYQGTTQRGTPMDTDVDPVEMMAIAYQTMEDIVLNLLESAPVKVVAMTGNHDRLLSVMLGMMLDARFRPNEEVTVLDGSRGSVYLRYGNALMGFNHGDSIKPEKLPAIMSAERPKDWGECGGNWDWFCGHLHSLILKVSEHNGCRVWTMPALSGTDRWHKLNGYVGNRKQLALFRVEGDRGVTSVELIEGKDEEN